MVCDSVLTPKYVFCKPSVVSISYAINSTNNDVICQKTMTKDGTLYHNVRAMIGAT